MAEEGESVAKQLAGMKPEDKVERMQLPKAANPFESLLGPIDLEDARSPLESSVNESAIKALRQLSPQLARDAAALPVLKLMQEERRLTVLPFRVVVE